MKIAKVRNGKVKMKVPFDPIPIINSFVLGGIVYAATADGLFRLDMKKSEWKRFTYSPDRAIPSNIKYQSVP